MLGSQKHRPLLRIWQEAAALATVVHTHLLFFCSTVDMKTAK
jgi:hypothetical protein